MNYVYYELTRSWGLCDSSPIVWWGILTTVPGIATGNATARVWGGVLWDRDACTVCRYVMQEHRVNATICKSVLFGSAVKA